MLGPKKTCQHCHASVPFELRQCECGRPFPTLTNELLAILKSTLPSGFTDSELMRAFTETKAEVPRDLANAIAWATQQVLRQPFQGSLAQALACLATLTHSTVPTPAASSSSSSSSSMSGAIGDASSVGAMPSAAATAATIVSTSVGVETIVPTAANMSEVAPPQKRAPPGPGALSLQVRNLFALCRAVYSTRIQHACMFVISCVNE